MFSFSCPGKSVMQQFLRVQMFTRWQAVPTTINLWNSHLPFSFPFYHCSCYWQLQEILQRALNNPFLCGSSFSLLNTFSQKSPILQPLLDFDSNSATSHFMRLNPLSTRSELLTASDLHSQSASDPETGV